MVDCQPTTTVLALMRWGAFEPENAFDFTQMRVQVRLASFCVIIHALTSNPRQTRPSLLRLLPRLSLLPPFLRSRSLLLESRARRLRPEDHRVRPRQDMHTHDDTP